MGLIIRLVELLIIVVPLVGVLIAAVKGFSSIRRAAEPTPVERPAGPAADTAPPAPKTQPAQWQTITRVVGEHSRTDQRWLSYEIDPAKLLEFPVMTDMREPLTAAFHRAKLRADLLRPRKAEDLLDDPEAASRYLEAVEGYVTAFDAAENDAMRRRRSDFSRPDQQRLARAQSLLRVATDSGATVQERDHAYGLARTELEGLLVLPEVTRAAIERGIAGEIGP